MQLTVSTYEQVNEGYDKFMMMTEVFPPEITKAKVIKSYGERLLKQNSIIGAFDTHTHHNVTDRMIRLSNYIKSLVEKS